MIDRQGHGLQIEIIELKTDGEENEDSEAFPEARVCPVIGRLCSGKDSDNNCCPYPKRPLEGHDHVESEPGTSLQGDINAINPILRGASMLAGTRRGLARSPDEDVQVVQWVRDLRPVCYRK